MINDKLDKYVQILNNIDDSQDKFMWIMDFGKNSRAMSDDHKVKSFEAGLLESLESQHSGLLDEITKEGKISEDLEKTLLSAIKDFKKGFSN